MTMQTMEAALQEIAGLKAFVVEKIEAGIAPLQEEKDRLAAALTRVQADLADVRRARLSNGAGEVPRVLSGPYAGMDPVDLMIASSLAAAQPLTVDAARNGMLETWRTNVAAAMDSTTVGAGDELVPRGEASRVWDDVNLETMILGLIPRVAMPTNPFDIPLSLGDVNWYPGTENVSTKSTKLATALQTLTAFELVGEVPWSFTLDEDSVIAMMEEMRRTLTRNAAEVIDDVLLNADTTVLNNINANGTTIAATDAGKGQWLLGFDGIIHLPLVTATGMDNAHSAAVSDDMFNEARRNMGKYGVRPSGVVHVMDIATWLSVQTITNVRTLDKYGPNATILTGELGSHEGIPIIVSEQMLKTASDGKVTDGTPGTVGRLLTFNRNMWTVGFKREISLETVRDVQKRQNIVVASMRIALIPRDAASTQTHTHLQRDITGI